MRLLLRGRTPSSERQASPAQLLADRTLMLMHRDCPGGRVALSGESAAECELHCTLCGEKTVVDREKLLQEVGSVLGSETEAHAVVAGARGGVVEITREAVAGRGRRRRKRDEGERKTLQITIIVLLVLISAFLLYGLYYLLAAMGAFPEWNREQGKPVVSSGGGNHLSPLSRLNYHVQIVMHTPERRRY